MSAAKARGTKWETTIARAFRAFQLPARRAVQEGRLDTGDIHGLSPFAGQAKDWRSWEAAIREGLDGVERQKAHAREMYGVAFVKRARRSVWQGYAVTTIATFARVLRRLRRAEALLREHAPDAYAEHMTATADEAAQELPTGSPHDFSPELP